MNLGRIPSQRRKIRGADPGNSYGGIGTVLHLLGPRTGRKSAVETWARVFGLVLVEKQGYISEEFSRDLRATFFIDAK